RRRARGGRARRAARRPRQQRVPRGCCPSRGRGRRAARSNRSEARSGRRGEDTPRAGTSSDRVRALLHNFRPMGQTLIAYLAAAVAAASHAAAPPNGATAALVARPLHGSVVLRAEPGGRPLLRVGLRGPLGGPLVLGVVAVRGRWVKVTAEALPNGHYACANFGRDVAVHPIQWALRATLSRLVPYLLRDGRHARAMRGGVRAAS